MDERVWADAPLGIDEALRLGTVTITQGQLQFAYLVSGALHVALENLAPGAPSLGLAEDAGTAQEYALRIARDSALLVRKQALTSEIGWHARAFGVSDAADVYAVLDISGKDADQVLAQGGISIPLEPSPSAAIQFAGLTVLLIRHAAGFRMFVPAAHLTFVTGYLRGMDLPPDDT